MMELVQITLRNPYTKKKIPINFKTSKKRYDLQGKSQICKVHEKFELLVISQLFVIHFNYSKRQFINIQDFCAFLIVESHTHT